MLFSLLPALFLPSFGTTPILEMVPPSEIHGSTVAWVSIDVLVVPNSSKDLSLFQSNSPLWSKAWTLLSVCYAEHTDSNASKMTPEVIFEPRSKIFMMDTQS